MDESTRRVSGKRDGRSKHPLRCVWVGMIRRCTNPKHDSYRWYGAKGVSVCERWLNDFWAFVEDVGPRPSRRHTLDRYPNRAGDYEPGNVRWATPVEQSGNTSRTRYIALDGRMHKIVDLVRDYGFSSPLLRRLADQGYSADCLMRGEPPPCQPLGRRPQDITNHRFGRLLAVRATDERPHGKRLWLCACDCGNTFKANVQDLNRGAVRSCGCLRNDLRATGHHPREWSELEINRLASKSA